MHLSPQFMLLTPTSKASVTKSRFHAVAVAVRKKVREDNAGYKARPDSAPRSAHARTCRSGGPPLLAQDRGHHGAGVASRPAAGVHRMQEIGDMLVERGRLLQVDGVAGIWHHHQT